MSPRLTAAMTASIILCTFSADTYHFPSAYCIYITCVYCDSVPVCGVPQFSSHMSTVYFAKCCFPDKSGSLKSSKPFLVSWTHNCAGLLKVAIHVPVLKQTTNKVKSHGSNVRNIIAHMISGDTQTNQLTDVDNLKQS